jgi:hypothetical protein
LRYQIRACCTAKTYILVKQVVAREGELEIIVFQERFDNKGINKRFTETRIK